MDEPTALPLPAPTDGGRPDTDTAPGSLPFPAAAEPSRDGLRTESQTAQQATPHGAATAVAEPSEAPLHRQAAAGAPPHAGPDDAAGGATQTAPVTGGSERRALSQEESGLDRSAIEQKRAPSCTPAQMRRFIKSRPWIPMHELRRRFGINGAEDDVTPIRVGEQRLFVGLPPPEGDVLAELLSGGDVGFELSLDPGAPIVIGVFPMRPVPRS
jgi:hypothetical protein